MISRKQWAVLLLFYLFYLIFGAMIFLLAERESETQRLKDLFKEQKRLTLATSFIENKAVKLEVRRSILSLEEQLGKAILLPNHYQHLLLSQVAEAGAGNRTEAFLETVSEDLDVLDEEVEEGVMWTLWNAFFFSFTAITTIGFGHMFPKTTAGQMFCLLYSIFGVPFNGILFAGLADLFANRLIKKVDGKRYEDKGRIVLDTILYLIPGILVFFVCPAVVFMMVEGWTFIGSIYFTFITLSTIGFGDMVSGYVQLPPVWLWIYRLFIQAWIIFGLGYLLMIITFIQRALRSKQMRILDRRMAKFLKLKKRRPSKTVQKDLEKLGSILKTISIMNKVKPGKVVASEEEEDGKFLEPLRDREPESGTINPAFEEDQPPRTRSHSAITLNKESDNTVDIFMKLAKDVLGGSQSNLNLETDQKSSETHNSLKTYVKDVTDQEIGPHQISKDADPNRNMSISRRLSKWTMNVLPHSVVSSHEKESSSPSLTETSRDNQIMDLGDLIEKVNEILIQEVEETREMDSNVKAKRSISFSNGCKNYENYRKNSLPLCLDAFHLKHHSKRKRSLQFL